MRKYLVRIVMSDGSRGEHHGLYTDGFMAIVAALTAFPEAMRVSALRLP